MNTFEKEELIELWHESFGDSYEDIGLFFDMLFSPELVYVTKEDGKIVSAMYLTEGHELSEVLPDGSVKKYRLTYLYALATKPSARGKGYGLRTASGAAELAFKRGADIVTLCPADEGLEKWYRERAGFTGKSQAKSENENPPAVKLAEDYVKLRDIFAEGKTEDLPDVVIYKTRENIFVPPFYFGPVLI